MTHITREHCLNLDREDTLAHLREDFDLPDGVIYLDGNSLGAMPKAAAQRAETVLRAEWGRDLIKSWNTAGWFELPSRLGNLLAPIIGANQDEVVVTDSTSINLFKALAAALQIQASNPATAKRRIIVSERSNFPSDLYMAEGLSRWLDRGYSLRLIDSPDDVFQAVTEDTAVVMLTQVNYRTGYLHDMAAVTAHAHAKGALALWDLAHSAGAVPVELNRCDADFAVGCTYKYLNGGPGSPAFIWVAKKHLAQFHHPLSGWWGHASPFAMQPSFEPTASIRRALCGTQGIVSMSLVECGLASFAKTDMQALRKKSLALTDLFIALVEQRCGAHGLELVTPREHSKRGSQVSLAHAHGYAVMQALIARGVIGDYRQPSILRFGFTPLYVRFADVWDAVEILRDILDNNAYDMHAKQHAVT